MKKINPCPAIINLGLCLYLLCNSLDCLSLSLNFNSSGRAIILDCGSAESSSFNGKRWTGDEVSKLVTADYEPTSTGRVIPTSGKAASMVPKLPYSTARFFPSPFTYSFHLSPGLIFIRLHFYPASYSGNGGVSSVVRQTSNAYFSVSSAPYTLLANFSPSVLATTLESPYFTKDYILNSNNHILNITFAPSQDAAFAFINGIEVYSTQLKLHDFGVLNISYGEPALEVLYRINIGGTQKEDPFWYGLDDELFIHSSQTGTIIESYGDVRYKDLLGDQYSEPGDLYTTARIMGSNDQVGNMGYNLTWIFPVDTGFKYIVRLHFCEISSQVTGANQRVFDVYINNRTAENSLDVVAVAGGPSVAIHKDYIIMVPQRKSKGYLWIALHPNISSKPKFADAILNGIEIMKLSDATDSLAVGNQMKNEHNRRRMISSGRAITGSLLGVLAGIFILSLIVYQLNRVKYNRKLKHPNMLAVVSSDHYRQFTLAEIRAITDNFSEVLVIGAGGFGKVYMGLLDNGLTKVAIKRKNSKSNQGAQEFNNEINFLSTFRHMNIVSLLGYCQEDNELILIYDYMERGTLREHLYKTPNQPLSWEERLKICIGAARGLHYLHTGTGNPIIHRDIKSTNILLDQNWVAKLSDFGLSKVGTTRVSSGEPVNTGVKGTFGYMDPEYYRTTKLTDKSDVYSFGVVLFEVLSARAAVNPVAEGDEKVSLVDWARQCYQSGMIDQMIDPFLEGRIMPKCLTTFVEIAMECLAYKQMDRPSMGDVLCKLELALLLQENAHTSEQITDDQ